MLATTDAGDCIASCQILQEVHLSADHPPPGPERAGPASVSDRPADVPIEQTMEEPFQSRHQRAPRGSCRQCPSAAEVAAAPDLRCEPGPATNGIVRITVRARTHGELWWRSMPAMTPSWSRLGWSKRSVPEALSANATRGPTPDVYGRCAPRLMYMVRTALRQLPITSRSHADTSGPLRPASMAHAGQRRCAVRGSGPLREGSVELLGGRYDRCC